VVKFFPAPLDMACFHPPVKAVDNERPDGLTKVNSELPDYDLKLTHTPSLALAAAPHARHIST
jgi:hypothetical protein